MTTDNRKKPFGSSKEALQSGLNQNGNRSDSAKLNRDDNQRPFTKINFYMMGGCLALIIIGFLLMSGGGSDDPTAFNPEIFSTRRIVVGPALSFLGFLLMAFAIIYTPKEKK